MHLVPALILSLALAMQAPSEKPTTKPVPGTQPPTGTQPATGAPAGTGAPITIQPVAPAEPPKPPPVPVPDGPVVNKQELEGGLIIEDIKIGTGYEVKPGGAVVAFYHGTLKADGKVFDSAFERGEPIGFGLSGVIPGWQKGVPGMKIGGVRRLTIPAALGYGAQGAGGQIPPNSDLVFVIQLVDAIQTEDIKEGEGEPATGTFVAVTAYTLKDAEGKEIEKADASHPYIWIPNELQGMQLGMEGMKLGGKRKIHIPKDFAKGNQMLAPNRPQNVAMDAEVEMLNLRVLNTGRRR
jgi:FKBP-type peptidyl-prolyl cis-trans isomerase